jgi:hypothetical protein
MALCQQGGPLAVATKHLIPFLSSRRRPGPIAAMGTGRSLSSGRTRGPV